MKPVLFYVESISLCHVARMTVIAQFLRDHGMAVKFACGENQRQIVQDKGFDAVTVPVLDSQTVYGRLTHLKPTYQYQELKDYYLADRQAVEQIDPAMIIYDMRLTIPLIGETLSIPTVSVANGIYSQYFRQPLTAPQILVNRSHLPQGLMDGFFGSGIGQWIGDRFERPFSKPIDQLYEEYGGTPLGKFANYLSGGDISLVADIPEIVQLDNPPTHVTQIGPAPWDPPASLCGDGGRIVLVKDRPIVYLSLGSSVFPEQLVVPSVESLLKAGYRVLLQLGHTVIEGLPTHEALHVHKFVANGWVLPQVDVLVSHGGVTTSYEAIMAGVPVIGIPSFTDQQWNMDRFVAAGVGRVLNPKTMTADTLRETIGELVGNSQIKDRTKELGTRVREYPIHEKLQAALSPVLNFSESAASYRKVM